MVASAVIVSFLLLYQGGLSTSQDAMIENTTSNIPSDNDNLSGKVSCATARGLAGSCVERRSCDFGTNAIDFTLYGPRGYKKPCPESEVCCPFSHQLKIELTNSDSTWSEEKVHIYENK